MRKLSLLLLTSLLALPAIAQRPTAQVDAARLQMRASYGPIQQQLHNAMNAAESQARSVELNPDYTGPSASPYGKVNAVAPIQLGRASNAFTHLRMQQNQVAYDDAIDMAMYIHRQDVTIFGGGTTENGKFRYDLSIDGGATFTTDIGPMQTTYTNYGRYPNGMLTNPTNSTNPFDSKVVYFAPTNKFPTPGWVGYTYGVTDVATSAPNTSDFYWLDGRNTLLPGGLCGGLDGEYWIVDNTYDGTDVLDTLRVMKGTWNSGTGEVDWVIHASPIIDWSTSFDGVPHTVGPNIAFSPDGMHGWIGWVGDINAGRDSIYQPIFMHSTDGGATWGAPMEMQLESISWLADSLQILWVDSLGNPASTGSGTCAFDCDLTVDVDGNPHLGVVVGTSSVSSDPTAGYSISSGLAMFLVDVTTDDGGATFSADYLAPVLTLRGEFGTPDANGALLTMDNCVQVSRTEDGEELYFSWVDSDTNVIGFGETNNIAPNMRIVGKRVSDGLLTCWKRVTDGDLVWDGKALFPAMAPTINEEGTDNFLPIVMLELITNDQSVPCGFWYFGNDAFFNDADFTNTENGSWDGGCYNFVSGIDGNVNDVVMSVGAFPNPTAGEVTIYFEMNNNSSADLSLMNSMGQVVKQLGSGNYNRGRHEVKVDVSALPAGIYFYSLRTSAGVKSGKLVVE